jgi:choline dehydrogenase-like flavoprotein
MVRADVCIIGGGLTGLLAAKAALAQGKKVVLIERGGEYNPENSNRDTWWKEAVEAKTVDDDGFVHYKNAFPHSELYFSDLVENESEAAPWSFNYNMRYGIGGAAQMWSGMTWRLMPEDFATKEKFGYGCNWPIGYDQISPYYDRAEQILEVSGPSAENRATYKYWPWNNNFKYEHFPLSHLDKKFQETLGDIGELVPQPHAVRNKPVEDGGCVGAKTCVSYCASKAIFKSNDRILPDIIFSENLEIIFNAAAVRIDWDNAAGKINYIVCKQDEDQELFSVKADVYFLCANAFENVRLIKYSELQNKKTFGRTSPWIGRFFSSHAAVTYTVVMRDEVYPVRGRPTHASVIEWAKPEFRPDHGGITLEVWNSDFTLGYGPAAHFNAHASQGHWGPHLFKLLKSYERRFCISMIFETEMSREKVLSLSPTRVDRFGIPIGRADVGLTDTDFKSLSRVEEIVKNIAQQPDVEELFENGRGLNGNHPLGGLRMSRTAQSGVINEYCRSHDFNNLYILGGGAFCSTGSFNPTLTITALALRAFDDPALGWTNAID